MNRIKLIYDKRLKIKKNAKLICFVAILLCLLTNVGFNFTLFEGQGCISIALDKWDMMHVNKAYLWVEDVQYEITDIALIKQIAKETMVATYSDVQYPSKPERWIELYYNDRLVRRMKWIACCEEALVYEADLLHWIWPGTEGFVTLSADNIVEQLEAIVEGRE